MAEEKIIPVKVALRIRPLVSKETREGCMRALELMKNEPQVHLLNTQKSFTFDYGYDDESDQMQVYQEAVKPIVNKLFKGYNVTVLAYGQTGSGKTHTMGTAYRSSMDPELEGVIPRAVKDIFEHIEKNRDTQYIVKMSFLELYNEQLFDLLSDKPRREDTIVDIREDTKGIKIPGLTETPVTSLQGTMNILEKASDGRVTAATAMNMHSSRSHAIFTLTLESSTVSVDGGTGSTTSKFHMVDLAGSERQKKTKAKGERLREGININMGLLALGNVISALGEESTRNHVPYRDSKLTRLLQDSLGGNSHTLMVACVSPADSNVEETISTLRYADRARKIKNKPIVNQDSQSAETARLRSQVQQLQLQLLQAGGVCNASVQGSELSIVKERLEMVEGENRQLTSALQSAMDESAHMSEKLLLSEQAQESLKNRLAELSAETEQAFKCLADVPLEKRDQMNKLRDKVASIVSQQKHHEKTLIEHDISRFTQSRDVSMEDENAGTEGDDQLKEDAPAAQDLGGASQALRQTELASQLQELNKVLIAKQELAEKMGANDEKFLEMRCKYEDALKTMEQELGKLQSEKDNLLKQQRNAGTGAAGLIGGPGPNNKVSEMRRKRIQELEVEIQKLKKQQQEKIRLAKINSQNEVKVRKLGEEITAMKTARVKLIKQMKEESEKVRQWKQAKEKEVMQLKQKDRKAQVQLANMERLHERQKNVLRRKMEETVAVNKRLKEAMEKKANARAQRGENDKTLVGSGERVRGWVSSELEVVVSAKEATKTKEQLIRDRKELNLELQKMKQSTRRTMTTDERQDTDKKLAELQQNLDVRNAQIAELQQQILSFNEEKEKEKTGDRWSRLHSMVEAKIAAQYLFDMATEVTATSTLYASEIRELRSQMEEISHNRDNLSEEIFSLKMRHEDNIVKMERDHEEKVLFLLRQLGGVQEGPDSSPEVTLGANISELQERIKFQAKEIDRMSNIHDLLIEKEKEVEELKDELTRGGDQFDAGSLLPQVNTPPVKKTGATSGGKKRVTMATEERYKEDELHELFSSSDESSDDEDFDEEWRMTPMFKRVRKERQSMAQDLRRKRRSSGFRTEEERPELGEMPRKKRSTGSSSGCACKSGCRNKRCSCKKAGPYCNDSCTCIASKCANREIPGDDVSDASTMSTDHEMDQSGGDTTSYLLDSTYSTTNKRNPPQEDQFTPARRPPLRTIHENRDRTSADIFALADSDLEIEATPTNKLVGGSFFVSPQLK